MAKAQTPPSGPSGGKSAALPPATPKPASPPVAPTPANQPSTVATSLVTMAVASTLKLDGLIAGIVHVEAVSRGAYSAFGKYRFYLEKLLTAQKSTAKISTILREKCGLSNGTISHTAYAMKTFAFVTTQHLTEAEYDRLSAAEMRAFIQVMGPESKKRLDVKQAITFLRAGLADGDTQLADEFDSMREHGLTIAEAEKAAKAAAAKEKLEQEARAAAEKKAAEEKLAAEKKASAEKAAQEALAAKAAADKKKADEQAAAAAAAKQKADEAAAAAKSVADKRKAEAAQKQADADAAAAAAAQQKAAEDATSAGTPSASPEKGKITTMPPQITVTLTGCGEQLDKLLEMLSKLPVQQQVAFYTTTWKAADSILADALKGHLKKAS